jgi:hypothetical protein
MQNCVVLFKRLSGQKKKKIFAINFIKNKHNLFFLLWKELKNLNYLYIKVADWKEHKKKCQEISNNYKKNLSPPSEEKIDEVSEIIMNKPKLIQDLIIEEKGNLEKDGPENAKENNNFDELD